MRDVSQLHPRLQQKVAQLQEACKKQGITIAIGECLRTVAEQDALYAQGRTKSGRIVTNCKGSTYSSMHQWGVAFDFYLKMDVDHDGQTADDAFNNATGLFNKVGKIGQSLGLEWGGSWKSIVDLPHFQLPDWGSGSSKLKSLYGSPDKFRASWGKSSTSTTTSSQSSSKTKTVTSYSKSSVETAEHKKDKYAGTYKIDTTSTGLNLRTGAGKNKSIITTIPKGKEVTCYGYYNKDSAGSVWYYVQYGKYTGYVKASFCKKK